MKRTLFILVFLLVSFGMYAQSLAITWELNRNDAGDQNVVESVLTITNNTGRTLTADGGWMIGYCWMSVHPFDAGEELMETEVCATYHTLTPTEAFRPLANGESREYTIRQRGSILRESNGPQGAFFVASPEAQPLDVPITTMPFTSPLQHTRDRNPGYADGLWMHHYNEPFCKAIPSPYEDENNTIIAPWYRPLNIMPEPKSVQWIGGRADFNAPIDEKYNKKLPAEGYILTIKDKKITMEWADSAGLFYAHQTLERLRENGDQLQGVRIVDSPDLHHRGIMLDVARNFTGKQEIFKILKAMAAYKLNIFHFHIVDDEAWRLEIPGLPELTEVGSRRGYTTDESNCLYPAYGGGFDPEAPTTANGFFTRQDYIDIVAFADSLHIQVIPEIDMPGHSRAAIRSMEARYNRLISESDSLASEYRLVDPNDASLYVSAQNYTDDVICIALPSCYRFVEKVLTEIIAMHAEAGQPLTVFHVGGDEVAKGAWEDSPLCQDFMAEKGLKDVHELKDYFLEQILAILRPQGIRIAGWEEIAMRGGEVNPKFAGDDVISWCWNSIPEWKGDEKPYKLANAGYPVVLACVGNLYIDMSYTNHQQERGLHWGGYTDEHATFDFLPYDIYRSVRLTMKREERNLDDYDKGKTLRLKAEARPKIYGLQGQLFAETIRSSEQVEEYIFPKLQGIAERGWNATPISYRNAAQKAAAQKGTSPDMALRLGRQAFEIERLLFSKQLYQYELPRLYQWGFSFHVAQPGIIMKEDNGGQSIFDMAARRGAKKIIYINNPVQGGVVHYTLDGTEPTMKSAIYQQPFILPEGAVVKAKIFYLGHSGNTTLFVEPLEDANDRDEE